jgi:hypothetical protein
VEQYVMQPAVRVEDRDTDMEQLQEIDRKEDYQTLDA